MGWVKKKKKNRDFANPARIPVTPLSVKRVSPISSKILQEMMLDARPLQTRILDTPSAAVPVFEKGRIRIIQKKVGFGSGLNKKNQIPLKSNFSLNIY